MRRHTGTWLLVVFGLLELGLALLQGFSGALSRWFTDQTQGIAFFIGLQLTILFAYLGLRHSMDAATILRLEDATRQLSSRVGQIQFLAEDRFYAEFESRIENAGRSVSISHLDTIPPTRLKGSTAEHYFKRLSDLVRRRSKIRFQRLERWSPEKAAWIEGLMRALEGASNFSMRVLRPDPGDRKLPCISVQLVDEDATFLVAISKHEPQSGPRDIYIHSVDGNRLWRDYYERLLWEPGLVLVDGGTPNWGNLAQLRSEAEE